MINLKKAWPTIALGLLLAMSLFLRLHRIGETQTFLEDEGRDVLIVKRMLDTGKPVLIGPQTSTGNMYLGPFYYYFITPALVLSGMDPVGPAIFIALTGVLTVYLIFRLSSKWFGLFPAWVSAILYAVMPYPVVFTRNSWNPNLAPLVSVLILMVTDKLKDPKKSSLIWFGVLGFLLGILTQLHYMALIMVGLLGLVLFWWWFKSKRLLTAIALGVMGFIISLAPFIIFEVRNDFVNTRAITRFIQAKEEHNIRYDLPVWLWWNKVATSSRALVGGLYARSPFMAVDPYEVPIVVTILTLTFFGLINTTRDRQARVLLGVLLFGSLGVLGIYQENVHRHYLGFLLPIVYLAWGSLVASVHKFIKWLGVIATIGVLVYSLPVIVGNLRSGATFQKDKAKSVAEYISRQADGRPYNLVSDGEANTTPYQYYTFISPNPPINTAAQDVFMICEGSICDKSDYENRQMFVTGPAHPSLGDYVGHPLATYVVEDIEVISNEHVAIGTWVAHLRLTPVKE